MRSLEYPEAEPKQRPSAAGWEQEDVFTELSIPLGTLGRPLQYPGLTTRCHFKATCYIYFSEQMWGEKEQSI